MKKDYIYCGELVNETVLQFSNFLLTSFKLKTLDSEVDDYEHKGNISSPAHSDDLILGKVKHREVLL